MYMSIGVSVGQAICFIVLAGQGELMPAALLLVSVICHLFMGVEMILWEQNYVAACPVPVHG